MVFPEFEPTSTALRDKRDYQLDYAEFQTSLLELRNAGINNTESPRVPRYQVPGTPVPGTPGYLVQVPGTRYRGTRYLVPRVPGTGYMGEQNNICEEKKYPCTGFQVPGSKKKKYPCTGFQVPVYPVPWSPGYRVQGTWVNKTIFVKKKKHQVPG